jgi:hypothetical protein
MAPSLTAKSMEKSLESRVLQSDEQLATSRLLFLAEFLETRIVPKRIEHRVEPE